MNERFYGLGHAVKAFRALDDTLPVRVMHTFLVIAGWTKSKEPSMSELAASLALHPAVVTRHVAALTETHWLGKPGLGVVEVYPDPGDSRFKRVRLTRKGETLRSTLVTIMQT